VVGALRDPDPRVGGRGFDMLRAYGLAVTEGVCADEAFAAHLGHITRVDKGRPAVTVKMALTADGKVAGPGGKPVRITGPDATARVHFVRSQADAIAVGIGTVLADDPMLTVRLPGLERVSPIRVVLDTRLRLPLACRLVASARRIPLWVLAGEGGPLEAEMALASHGVEVMRVPMRGSRLDLGAALRLLGNRGLTRLLVEAGPTLAKGLIEADLVEELMLFTSPEPMGEGVRAFDPATLAVAQANLPNLAAKAVGRDIMTIERRS
jgi:diaminohydroxyphosphoribosylaminopyrimidine deaminase/5-amino-6-(5-phosphoribosylamino)uracil reductase